MAIQFVRQAAGTTFGTTRNQTITSPTSGNALILVLLHQSSDATVDVTDNGSGTWTRLAGSNDSPANATSQYKISIWYRLNVTTTTTTVTASASPGSALCMNVSEWSGIGSEGTSAVKYDATTGTTSGAASLTANTGELVIGGTAYFKSADGVSTSTYTSLTSTGTSTTREGSAYWIATSTGSTAPDFSYDTPGANNVGTVTATFVPAGITATPNSISSAESVPSPTAQLSLTATPNSISSAESVPSPTAQLALTATPNSIASAESFGSPTATITGGGITATPNSIASAESFGTPTASLALTATPDAIPSGESFGTPSAVLSTTYTPNSIASGESFGAPVATISITATPNSIPSAESFGSPAASLAITATPSSIASQQSVPSPTAVLTLLVAPEPIASQESFGVPTALFGVPADVDVTASFWPQRTTALLSPPRWKAQMAEVSQERESLEFVAVKMTVDGVVVTSGVQIAIVPARSRPTTWTDATILSGKTGLLVSGLEPGSYDVFAKVTSNPEVPVKKVGTLKIR